MPHPLPELRSRRGFALVTVLALGAVLMALLAALFALTNVELRSVGATVAMSNGFHAAEAGLNLRGESIRQVFQGFQRPRGASPDGQDCAASPGSGDFACETFRLNDRTVTTFVVEDARNDDANDTSRYVTVPPGEAFAGLNAVQYRYTVRSEAVPDGDERPEAILETTYRVRLVPLFQFAAFYDKDLEILPGPTMQLNGRVHTNGDLYLNANATLEITGQVTAAERGDGTGGAVHRGRKDDDVCGGTVLLPDGSGAGRALRCGGSSFGAVEPSDLAAYNGQVRAGLDVVNVPSPETFGIDGLYWAEADVRLALDLRFGPSAARVVALAPETAAGAPTVDTTLTALLHGECTAADANRVYEVRSSGSLPTYREAFGDDAVRPVEFSDSFYDHREAGYVRMLEVDVAGLLDCMDRFESDFFADRSGAAFGIGTDRHGGLVWYLTVLGPDADASPSRYGVRLRNGAALAASEGSAPDVAGLTVVTDQAAFVQGDYNADRAWRPASILADSLNVLSRAWDDDADSRPGTSLPAAADTTVRAAFLAGTDATGGAEGAAGRDGAYNGGLENFPRFHESWSGDTLTYEGSFVSLGTPRRASGRWADARYSAPLRDWDYDARFDDADDLPPLTPRFVYLVQQRFDRSYER